MRYYLHSLIVIFLLYSTVLEAQKDVSIRRKDYMADKSGFGEAWKNVSKGDSYYTDKGIWYVSAFDEYLK